MPGAADASIVFDTRMDPSGFENGLNNISDRLNDAKNLLVEMANTSTETFGSKTQREIESLSVKMARQVEQLNKAKGALEKLQDSYDKIAKGETPLKSVQGMEKELARINAEKEKELVNNERLVQLYIEAGEALEAMQKTGTFPMIGDQVFTSAEEVKRLYESVSGELEHSGNNLERMDKSSQELSANIDKVRLDPSSSQEAKEMAESISQAAERANRLSYETDILENKVKTAFDSKPPELWTKSVDRGNKAASRLSLGVKDIGKSANSVLKPLGRMVNSIRRIALTTFVFQVVRRGMREIRQYISDLTRTNNEFNESLESIKLNLMVAFQPIYDFIIPAITQLMSILRDASAYLAQFVSMLFGSSYEASREAAKAANEQAEALKKVGKEARQAGKSVQGFDQLNRQQAQGSSDDSAEGKASSLFEKVAMPDFDPKWAKLFEDSLNKIKKAVDPLLSSLKKLWEQGLKPLGNFIWRGLRDFYDQFLVPVGRWVLGEGLPRFVDAITKQLAKVDWERLNGALAHLWEVLGRFAIKIGEGLLWFWEVVLTPLIGWAIDNLLPVAIELVAEAIEFLNVVIDAAAPAFEWFWETFLVPLRDFVWEAVINFIKLLTDAFKGLTKWAKENPQVIETIAKIVLTFLAGLWMYNTVYNLISFLSTLGRLFPIFAAQMGTLVVAALPAMAIAALAAAFVLIGGMWDKLSPASQVAIVLSGLAAAAVAAAIAIAVFHASWSVGIAAAVIIGSIVAIGVAFAALKSEAGADWKISTPKIDPFGSPGSANPESFMGKLGKGSPLPALAQGGLIPPRKPRAVIVGDNMSEDEIVSPRSAIREEVKNAILELGGVGGDAQVVGLLTKILGAIQSGHTIEMNERELGRTVIRSIRGVQNQTGQVQIQTTPRR